MSFMDWKDAFSVGVASVDVQHKKLVELINRLYDAMRAGQGSAVVSGIVKELSDYTVEHFTYEEGLMQKAGYPGLAAHKVEHKNFVDKVGDFEKGLSNGKIFVTIEVMTFLGDWLRNHIMGIDKQYSAFLNDAGIQ